MQHAYRGYFGIGVYGPKTVENIGTLWRSAHNFGAAFLFTIGRRYHRQASDTTHAGLSVPLYNYLTFEEFLTHRPNDCSLVAIEQSELSRDVKTFIHPQRCIYLLGAEDTGLPLAIQERCKNVIHISTPMCLNVAVAGSIIMYDRFIKQ